METFRNRSEITRAIKEKNRQLNVLKKEIDELRKVNVKFCDKNQWFEEIVEEVVLWKRPKLVAKMRMGYCVWKEKFTDYNLKKTETIERRVLATVNGNWEKNMELAKARDKAISAYRKSNPESKQQFKDAVTVDYLKRARC